MNSPGTEPDTLAERLAAIRDRANGRLRDLRTYYVGSRLAWAVFKLSAGTEAGRIDLLRRGIDHDAPEVPVAVDDKLKDLTRRADGYLLNELPTFAVRQLASIHEEFLAGVVRAWLLAKPRHLIQDERTEEERARRRGEQMRTVTLKRILEGSRESIIQEETERAVEDFARASVKEQYARLKKLTRADLIASHGEDVLRLAELAATRNALVHADGVAGDDYFAKAGNFVRVSAVGERLPLPDDYVGDALDRVGLLTDVVAEAARREAGGAPARG